MKRAVGILTLALVATSIFGCRWHQRDMIGIAVWSDDDSAQAYVRARWEEKESLYPYPIGAAVRRDFEHRLYVQNADGSGRVDLYGLRPDINGTELYYVKTQGYLIVSLVEEESRLTHVDKVTLAGQVTTIISSDANGRPCGTVTVLPSPDGTRLAVIERTGQPYPDGTDPPDPGALCSTGIVRVQLLAANDLTEVASFEWSVDREIDATWNPAGELFVGTYQTTWLVDPISGPAITTPPDCMQPRTTSSNVSADGVLIAPDNDTDAAVSVVATDLPMSQRFGCQ